MLGFAPLASIPLGAVGAALILVSAPMTATGAITFGGSANAGAKTFLSASGSLIFSGSAAPRIEVYRSATGAIQFAGDPNLRVAGKPLVFTALPDSFTFRAEQSLHTFTAVPQSFTFRGVR